MPKKKRVNPRRKPLPANSVKKAEMLNEAVTGNMYDAWFLVLPALLEVGIDKNGILDIWNSVNDNAMTMERPINMKKAEDLMGYPAPYNNILLSDIHSVGELESIKRKMKEKAIHAALAVICLGIDSMGEFSKETIRKIFLNASLTLEEIRLGYSTYESILENLKENGICVKDDEYDMVLEDC